VVRFNVRDYRREDFHILWQIDQSCFPPGISYSQFELKTYIGRRDAFTLVAESDESGPSALLGFVISETSRRMGHIITIDVRSEARRHRLGSALLKAAEGRLKVEKCSDVRLETAVDNLSALAFYKRHGYSVMDTIPRYYSNGVDALLLEKNLLSPVSSS
jgi:[ribosomal protein S18]-alanine N-acetyltransferase